MGYHGEHSVYGRPLQSQVQVRFLTLPASCHAQPVIDSYPYIFLNDEPFTEDFKMFTTDIASGETSYGLIPKEQWSEHPSWIDEDRAAQARADMSHLMYGDSLSYRHMCRYESGFFFRHPLLADLYVALLRMSCLH